MATEKNICEFCGQVMVDGMECNCPAAKEKHEIERQIADAKMAIKYVFVNSFDGEMCVPPSDEVIKGYCKAKAKLISDDTILWGLWIKTICLNGR